MIVFTPFLLLASNYVISNIFGISVIFILMRGYSAYLHKAGFNKTMLAYVFYLPEIATGPFRSYAEWTNVNFRGFFRRLNISKILNYIIAILLSGVLFSKIYDVAQVPIFENILIYLTLYIQFCSITNIINLISTALGLPSIQNFNSPLLAVSISDFWSRWHMSLGSFARTHFNQPLTLFFSRKGVRNQTSFFLSIIFTFIFIGFWHNYSLNYFVFGLYFGFVIFIERIYSENYFFKKIRTIRSLGIVYTQTLHMVGFSLVGDFIYKILIKV